MGLFRYVPSIAEVALRWTDLPRDVVMWLTERDRQLEDYLASLSPATHTHATLVVPICEVRASAALSVVNNTDTLVTMNTLVTQTVAGMHTSPGITVPVGWGGHYLAWSIVKWDGSNAAGGTGGYRSHHLYIGAGATLLLDHHHFAPEGAATTGMSSVICRGLTLAAGDRVDTYILQQHTALPGALNAQANDYSLRMGLIYQGPAT